MGKKLDALLGRNSKTSKLKTLTNLAISRIAVLKNQRQVRCSHAWSDVIQLLNLGHQESALLRVEHVIREKNMLDAFIMIENYCHLLVERILLFQNNRDCPDELREATSSLIFAASRCGELPELQHLRAIFTSWFGKEFAASAVELRNNCGVNPKMIQKLSMRQATFETRLNVLKQIASDNGITLHLEDETSITKEKHAVNQKWMQVEPKEAAKIDDPELGDDAQALPKGLPEDEKFSESVKARKKYRDVVAAAQDAFVSAAYAAAAARAAVELSRSESWDEDPNDHGGSNHQQGIVFRSGGSSKSKLQIEEDEAPDVDNHLDKGLGFDKIHPIDGFSSESEGEEMAKNSNRSHLTELKQRNKKAGPERIIFTSSLNAGGNNSSERKVSSNLHDQNESLGEEIVFDVSDDETGRNEDNIMWLKRHDSGSDMKSPINGFPKDGQYNTIDDLHPSHENKPKLHSRSPKWIALTPQANSQIYHVDGRSGLGNTHQLNDKKHLYVNHSERDRKPASVRTRQVHRH